MNHVIALLYHDVLSGSSSQPSGFEGPDAEHYKISDTVFREHLTLITESKEFVEAAEHSRRGMSSLPPKLCLTFDDGGKSALNPVADLLQAVGLRAYFFVPTDFIGTKGFMSGDELRELANKGHVIGAHSASHPIPISSLSRSAAFNEWKRSKDALEAILGSVVHSASVPGGFTSSMIEETAEEAGFGLLFTSEPTRQTRTRGEMTVVGRYSVARTTSADEVSALANGNVYSLQRQWALWQLKKALKRIGGRGWLAVRRKYFELRR